MRYDLLVDQYILGQQNYVQEIKKYYMKKIWVYIYTQEHVKKEFIRFSALYTSKNGGENLIISIHIVAYSRKYKQLFSYPHFVLHSF